MEKEKKPKYNMWQNVGFMIDAAWKRRKSVLVLCVLLALTTAGKTVAELLVAPVILDRLETSAPAGRLIATIALFTAILLLLAGLSDYIDSNTLFGRVAVRVSILLRVAHKRASTSYPNTLDTDFLGLYQKASHICGANSRAAEAVWTTLTLLMTYLIGFAVYLALLTGLNLWLMLLVAATSAASYFAGKRINEWGYRHREEQEQYENRLSYLNDVATDGKFAKDIRIFGLRGWIDDIWRSTMRLYRAFCAKREHVYIWANIIDLLLTVARNGVAYAFLISLALKNGLSVSHFLLYFGAISGFAQWVTGILEQLSTLHRQSLEISMLREFLEYPEPFKFEDGEPVPRAADGRYELRLDNVSFRYPAADTDTLSHISLTIAPGEKLAIVGLNGAGKTTLVKLLCGFLDPTGGRVLLNGKDIRSLNRRDYYTLFSTVFQDFSVLDVSVAENVAQSVEGVDIARVWKCLDEAGLTEAVKALPRSLDTPVGRKVLEDGAELSGGQTQRLMLARALYRNAPVLLLDEPTAALDPIAENDIYMKYNEMTHGKTALFISHRLASTRFCDRIIFLDDGVIAEEGTHESLLRLGGGYSKLFEVQSRYYRKEVREND